MIIRERARVALDDAENEALGSRYEQRNRTVETSRTGEVPPLRQPGGDAASLNGGRSAAGVVVPEGAERMRAQMAAIRARQGTPRRFLIRTGKPCGKCGTDPADLRQDRADIATLLSFAAHILRITSPEMRERVADAVRNASVTRPSGACGLEIRQVMGLACFNPRCPFQARLRSGPDLPPVPRDKGCNMHPDCDAAEEAAARAGKPERYGPGSQRLEHCTDEFCEDCHGT